MQRSPRLSTPAVGRLMKTHSKLLPALLLLILVVPQVDADEPPENGKRVTYYENGQKAWENHYKNGKQEGLGTGWYENGQKQWESHHKDGKREGLWITWHPQRPEGRGVPLEERRARWRLD